MSGLVAFVVTAIWAATGGSFWPIWVWFGLAIPFGLNARLSGARACRAGAAASSPSTRALFGRASPSRWS